MPYQCRVERGRVLLTPAPERSYEIIGQRRQQPHLFCAGRDESRCRLRMLHRFEVACAGGRASWIAVAAAAARIEGRDAYVEGGRLHVVAGYARLPSGACGDASFPRLHARGAGAGPAERPCLPRHDERATLRVMSLPPGFAPLSEIGARIVVPPARTASAAASVSNAPATAPSPAAVPGTPHPSHLLAPASPFAPPPELASAPLLLPELQPPPEMRAPRTADPRALPPRPPAQADVAQREPAVTQPAERPITVAEASRVTSLAPWSVTVSREADDDASLSAAVRGAMGELSWVFLGGLLTVSLAIAGLAVRSSGRSRPGLPLSLRARIGALDLVARAAPAGDLVEERINVELRRTAEQLRSNADMLLQDLRGAPPLRGVLRQEIDLIAQRLADMPRNADVALAQRQSRQRLQTGIRELHRVIKIAEGAAASFSDSAPRPKMPTTSDEAYQLLGVNDAISDATLKKLVDALRMSWHPDHAADDADRMLREERIKQINVACDLIAAVRSEPQTAA